MNGIVIVGAGECGVRAAFALRESGFEGPVRLIGAEPHLPYERPPLTKGHPATAKAIVENSRYAEAQIDRMANVTVRKIDRAGHSVELADGRHLPYDKLLLATGARPRLFPGMDSAATLRTFDDAQAIFAAIGPGKHLVIVGGGFIGLELAAVARGLGAEVTVLEAADRLMARIVPEPIADIIGKRHADVGVKILTGATVAAARPDGVTLADGRTLDANLVVAGIGAVPNTELAAAAGLAIDNGITVDHRFGTEDATIFAAGDCAAFPYRGCRVRLESWRAAQDHGNHVARAMLGDQTTYVRLPWFWSDQYDLVLQIVGLPEPDRDFIRRDLADDAFILFQCDDGGRLISASGVGPGTAVARDIRLAEMMIERLCAPDPARLVDPQTSLKTLLRSR